MHVLIFLSVLAIILWTGVLLHPYRPFQTFSDKDDDKKDIPQFPHPFSFLVSVIIPARNEEETIEKALSSHFQSNWKELEVILVNDNSDDATCEKAQEARKDATCPFKLIQAGNLPEFWVGKVNAMAQGVKTAKGDYLLFTDADIVFSPGLLTDLVIESENNRLGLNSRMVFLSCSSLWERLLVPAFVYFFTLLYPFRAVSSLKSRIAAAAGGCMLVKRDALEKAGGLKEIKDRIIDDVALGKLIKKSGFPIRLKLTKKAHSLRRYSRLPDFWHTVTRTAFSELRYSWLRLAVVTIFLLEFFCIPVVALVAGLIIPDLYSTSIGAAALVFSCLLYLPTVFFFDIPFYYALSLPFTGILYLGMTWHSALQYLSGKRSSWKKRDYKV